MIDHVYAIKRRNEFIQRPVSSRGRGGSWMQPVNPRYEYPRVFTELRHARIYLTGWLKGGVPCESDYDDWGYYTWPGAPIPDPTRRREDMEITMLRIHPYDGGDTDFKVMYFLECDDKWLPSKLEAIGGSEAREFECESIYGAQFFKSELAARRYLIKWRRGPAFSNPVMSYNLKLREATQSELDAYIELGKKRNDMNIRIVPYVYKECQ